MDKEDIKSGVTGAFCSLAATGVGAALSFVGGPLLGQIGVLGVCLLSSVYGHRLHEAVFKTRMRPMASVVGFFGMYGLTFAFGALAAQAPAAIAASAAAPAISAPQIS